MLWPHGGPHSSWAPWTWRWNPWLLAARGYAVLMPDPALSLGYGQDMIRRGHGTWATPAYDDLMAITDVAVARDDVDATRTAVIGGSPGRIVCADVQRKADTTKIADSFEAAIGEIVQAVASAATELEASATTLASNADHARDFAARVANGSDEASSNVNSVASATEEMTASVREISQQVQESARMANDAVDQVHSATERVSALSSAAVSSGRSVAAGSSAPEAASSSIACATRVTRWLAPCARPAW